MKFLIISSSYPPWKTVGGLRSGMMANELVKSGHECAVLTIGLDVLPETDDDFLRLDKRIIEKRISPKLIIPYGLNLPGGGNPGLIYKILRKITNYWTPDVYYYWALRAAKQYISSPPLKPDIVISSALPFSVHHAGQLISEEYNALWIAEFRDLYVDNPYMPMTGKRRKRALAHQKRLLSKASLVLGISDEMVNILRESTPDNVPTATLMNALREKDVVSNEHKKQDHATAFSFVYTGRLYDGYRDLEPFLKALSCIIAANNDFKHITIRIIYAGPDGNLLTKQAAKYNLQDIVVDRRHLSRTESLSLQRNAEVLLLSIGKGSKKDAMVITGKVFEYLSSKRPILALGYPEGALARLLEDTGAGNIFSIDDIQGICNTISQWLEEFKKSGSVFWNIPDEKIAKHSWRYRIKELMKMIEELKV